MLYAWAFFCLAYMTAMHPLALVLIPLAALAYWFRERWPMTRRNGAIVIGLALMAAVAVSYMAKDGG